MSSVTPIFVLGSARSGTTWLSNLLAAHPAIATAHHRVHWGSVESEMAQYARYAGDLREPGRLVRFVEVFASTDLFRLLEGDKARIYQRRPADAYDLLLDLFDDFAAARGASAWSTKLDPSLLYRPREQAAFLARLDARYPSIRWVGITRDVRGVVRSYLQMEGQRSIHALRAHAKAMATVLESGRYVVHNRAIAELLERRGGLALEFAELKADEAAARRRLSTYLGLDLTGVRSAYPPNSSHGGRRAGDGVARAAWVADRVLVPAFRRAPQVATALLHLRDRTRPPRAPFYWRLLQLEQMPDQLARELQDTGQTELHAALFE